MNTEISKLIADHRISLNITQTQLGKKLGWGSAQFVSNIERGISGLPLAKSKKLCRILCIKQKVLKDAMIADFAARVSQTLK